MLTFLMPRPFFRATTPPDPLYPLRRLIFRGFRDEADAAFKKFDPEKLPREMRAEYARLAVQGGHPDLGAASLAPLLKRATEEERATYAYCLHKLGASAEAAELLSHIDKGGPPSALLYEAEALLNLWKPEDAIRRFKSYLARPDLTPVEREMGFVRLASAHQAIGDERTASAILRRVLHDARVLGNNAVTGHALELAGVAALSRKRFTDAARLLVAAARSLEKSGSRDEIFVRRWRAMVESLRTNGAPTPVRLLNAVRKRAAAKGRWHTVRDVDRVLAMAKRDEDLFARVYWGTPSPAYRKRLLMEWKIFTGTDAQVPPAPTRDFQPPKSKELKTAFETLTADAYEPVPAAALRHALFPKKPYDAVAGLAGVKKAIEPVLKRVKAWLKAEGIPYTLVESKSGYKLEAQKPRRRQMPLRA